MIQRNTFFRAAPAVIEQMKAEQSLNVDAVSGATYSSNGVIHAVANALEIPEDQYAPRPGRNLTAKEKDHGHIVKHEITSQEEYEGKSREIFKVIWSSSDTAWNCIWYRYPHADGVLDSLFHMGKCLLNFSI